MGLTLLLLEECHLLAFIASFDEHLAEDVEEHVNDDTVASEFILCRVADSCGLYLVDVLVVHSHEAEALAGCQLADAEFLALQLRGQLDCVLVCHICFVCDHHSGGVVVGCYCSSDVLQWRSLEVGR